MRSRPGVVDPVLVRAAAAVELLRADPAVDPALVLSYVISPTISLEKVPAPPPDVCQICGAPIANGLQRFCGAACQRAGARARNRAHYRRHGRRR